MADRHAEYNPLDYANLTRNCVEELMRRPAVRLPLEGEFPGAGVYALFYGGNSKMYSRIQTENATWPIYVGKAVPPGGRKGRSTSGSVRALYARLMQHTKSIEDASNLEVEDFVCRYLVVTPLWITMAERFLVTHYQPAWNVCIEGFGNHDPGKGRHEGEITWWDALHPGRPWAQKLRPTRSANDAKARLSAFLKTYRMQRLEDVLAHQAQDDDLAEFTASGNEEQ